MLPDLAWADPTGGSVVAGAATIVQDGTALNVTSVSDRTIINWQGFSIDAGQSANFLQPSASSAVLNRVVTPGNPSLIYGTLSSNGNVFLVNPSGILVGPSGVINTNGFAASVLDIHDSEFLQGGELTFRGNSTASVINQGTIHTGDGGAALIGGDVVNEGTITSVGGSISLATGGTVTLADGSRFTHADLATIESGISPYVGVIRNSGAIRATGAMEVGGEVYLVNPGGKLLHDGTIAAHRTTPDGEVGGKVVATGKEVELAGATVDASGANGGGEVYIGGGKQGADASIANATVTTVDAATTINADATAAGNGGTVVVWSDDTTKFAGRVTARGGAQGGDGGFVETSGARFLQVAESAYVDALAALGRVGDWLLDPRTITVATGGTATLAQAADSSDATSDITIAPSTINNAAANVTLWASETINVNDAIAMTNSGVGITFQAGTAINLDASITSNGAQTYNGPVILLSDTILTSTGAADITFNSTVNGLFNLTVSAGGDISFSDTVGDSDPLAGLAVMSGGEIVVGSSIETADGDVDFVADEMDLSATIDVGAGIVTLAPKTAGRTISLGVETAGSLSLTDTEIDQVDASVLRIGSVSAGSIDFADIINPAGTDTLSLITGDEILNTNGGTDVQVANLALEAVNGIGNDSQIDMDVDTVAALNTTAGGIALIESFNGGDLVVGTVDGVVGIRNEASTGFSPLLSIQLETNNGDLTVNNDIFTSRRNIFIVAQFQNGRDGDRTFTNNANIINADSGSNTSNGRIDIRANNMTLSAGSTISAANRVILEDDPSATSTIAINLGGADGVNTLGLTDAELDTVTTDGVLQIGHTNSGGSGDITITSPIAFDPNKVSTVDIETGGSLTTSTAAVPHLSVQNLALRTGGGVGPILTDVNNLAFSNTSGFFFLLNDDSLTITAVDGLTTSSNTGLNTFIQAQGVLTFAVDTSSTANASYVASTSIDVANGVVVSSGDLLDFDSPTVNLDGDLMAANGISGRATTVNVLSDTGGAEIQDAVDVALPSATVGDNVTINIAAGTYDGFVVPFFKTNLTIIGAGNDAGSLTTVEANGGPAIIVNANGTTVQDMLLTYGGVGTPSFNDVGILLNGDGITGTFKLTGINIINVDMSNLDTGVVSTGNIGDGNPASVDVTIRGNSNTDRAIFEDFQFAAIEVGDSDGDAVYVIKDIILQDGADADDLASLVDGIRLGRVQSATVQGVNMTHDVAFDGIFIIPFTLSDANILIGGPAAEDANTIRGLSDGIDTGHISGGTFVVQGNSMILGGDDAINFNGVIVDDAVVQITGNANITGNEDGLDIGGVGNSTLTIADNGLIQGLTQNGIEVEGPVQGTAVVKLLDNESVVGAEFAVQLRSGIRDGATLAIEGGTYEGGDGALLVDNSGVGGANGSLNIGAVDLVADAGGTVVEVLSDTGNAGVDVDFSGAATLRGGAIGIRLSGPGINVLNDTFGEIVFRSQSNFYIVLANGAEFLPGAPTLLDATSVDFEGLSTTLAGFLLIESRIIDFVDNPTLGLIIPSFLSGGFGNYTYDQFTRYEDFFRTIHRFLAPRSGVIRWPVPRIDIDDSLHNQVSQNQPGELIAPAN